MTNTKNAILIILLIISVGLVFQIVSPYISGKVISSNDIVRNYKLDGNVLDTSISGVNGISNGVTFTSGQVNQAGSFNGVNNYINIGDIPLTNTLTLEAWIKPTNIYYSTIISKWDTSGSAKNSYILFLENIAGATNRLRFYMRNSAGQEFYLATPNDVISLNQWSHVVATYDGSNMKVYVNGVEKASIPATGNVNSNTALKTYLGVMTYTYKWTFYYTGLMDEVKVYNKALSASEVLNNYQVIVPAQVPTLLTPIVFYSFDDGTVIGRSGNAKSFNGVSDYVPLDYNSLNVSQLSVETWFKTNSVSSMALYSQSYSHKLFMNNGILSFTYYDDRYSAHNIFVNSILTYNDGNWHHVVGTYDGSNLKLYVDGVLIATTPSTTAIIYTYSAAGSAIGRNGNYNTNYFNGGLDEFKFYNRALTAVEVQNNYNSYGSFCNPETDSAFCSRFGKTCGQVIANDNCGVSRTVANCGSCISGQACNSAGNCVVLPSYSPRTLNLVGYWNFNEGSGNIANDLSGNLRHFVSPTTSLASNPNNPSWNPSWSSGIEGTAWAFDGINDFASIPSSNIPLTSYTLTAWVKPYLAESSSVVTGRTDIETGTNYNPIIVRRISSNLFDYGITFSGRGSWIDANRLGGGYLTSFNAYSGGQINSYPLSSNRCSWDSSCSIPSYNNGWTHITASFDSSNTLITMYLNGRQVNQVTSSTLLGTNPIYNYYFYIGFTGTCSSGTSYCHYHGSIDESKLYSAALTASEVKAEYCRIAVATDSFCAT